jgi:hypothetical protein
MKTNRIAVWVIVCALGAAAAIVLVVAHVRQRQPRSITLQGTVIQRDADTRKQVPIAGATVTVSNDAIHATASSSPSGYFRVTFRERLTIRERVRKRETVHLDFRAPGYHPLDMDLNIGLPSELKQLFVAEMNPVVVPAAAIAAGHPPVPVANVLIRYTVNYQAETEIGTAVKTFQVVNQGNVPCKGSSVCSPDGLWKASRGSVTLDAGTGNIFHGVRALCIAGPCPFTQIHSGSSEQDEQTAVVSAVDWSDTATFLVEAEVFHKAIASSVRESYPVIYGRDLHFTLPSTAEGPSIEAEIDGTPIVFPLGSGLYMDWATCTSRTSPQSKEGMVYQCELKPGYRF